jgi:hypothetical protein
MSAYKEREALWCERIGVKQSPLMWGGLVAPSVHRFLSYPSGFDHTVLYVTKGREFLLLTEPYRSQYGQAWESVLVLVHDTKQKLMAEAGRFGSGLWLPGACCPILIAKTASRKLLTEAVFAISEVSEVAT